MVTSTDSTRPPRRRQRRRGTDGPLYRRIADLFENRIRRGVLTPGERLPSVRSLAQQRGVSIATALQAYLYLARRGLVEARARSGHYARSPFAERVPRPAAPPSRLQPQEVALADVIDRMLAADPTGTRDSFGATLLGADLIPTGLLNRLLREAARRHPEHLATYELPAAAQGLARQIARRSATLGCRLEPERITITCGGMEALNLALRAVAARGDVVAVESPTYYGVLQAMEALGLRVLEIPSDTRTGPDLAALEALFRRRAVAAALVMTNGHNPLGYVLPDDTKRSLAQLASRHEIPIIEDDVYGDLPLRGRRPGVARAFDESGHVILCSSFSKALSPGLRLGWIDGGRYMPAVRRLKALTTITTANLPCLAVAELIASGAYERHLRRARPALCDRVERAADAVYRHFPDGTRLTRPAGGFVLWVQLPRRARGVDVYREAARAGIHVFPGTAFSPGGRFPDHVRLSCGGAWTEHSERCLRALGRIVERAATRP
jgi:DNA-binding transcriptional MocR family regulator